ncbi:mitochondrial carrier [Violaceomyces palustris]|uniref:Mitochondrial carrier n=1 Tax=Violaceomyces palustris TaxID=1673888 RepID=A0ACD0NQI5_9BASI|nr:mitochondrial carrier [Violaceomyces palustris]
MASSSSTAPSPSSSSPPPPTQTQTQTLSFFPTPALDHAFAGIAAGAAATVCMNPLDLIKTKFQVDTSKPRPISFPYYSSPSSSSKGKGKLVPSAERAGGGWRYYAMGGKVGKDMVDSLKDIVKKDGWKGLYRGLSPNVAGNSASWGLYFLWYTMIKEYMSERQVAAWSDSGGGGGQDSAPKKLSAGQHLLAASESGAITAMMTNPIWVVKTRMFTTPPSSSAASSKDGKGPIAYRGLWHGLTSIARNEGIKGLYKGAGLALFGVSNGAIQFMAYEEMKKWRTSVAIRKNRIQAQRERKAAGGPQRIDESVQLSNIEYILMSGSSKVAAILLTYPYQVIRSRIQNHATSHIYPDIPTCVRLTWTQEGFRAFYKGLVPNLVRIIPGTCVTFVVYENVSWGLKGLAKRKLDRISSGSSDDNMTTMT